MHSASHELSMVFITIIPECFEKACGDFYKHTPQKEGGSVLLHSVFSSHSVCASQSGAFTFPKDFIAIC